MAGTATDPTAAAAATASITTGYCFRIAVTFQMCTTLHSRSSDRVIDLALDVLYYVLYYVASRVSFYSVVWSTVHHIFHSSL
jgi:uncharacterized protein YfaA (DUF2138 family)